MAQSPKPGSVANTAPMTAMAVFEKAPNARLAIASLAAHRRLARIVLLPSGLRCRINGATLLAAARHDPSAAEHSCNQPALDIALVWPLVH